MGQPIIFNSRVRANLGTIADRNGGENPFAGIFDLRLTKDFNAGGRHKFTLSTDVFNFSNLLNKDWGSNYNFNTFSTQTLLFVTGSNQATKDHTYRVNENIGVLQANATPYQVQVGARYSFKELLITSYEISLFPPYYYFRKCYCDRSKNVLTPR